MQPIVRRTLLGLGGAVALALLGGLTASSVSAAPTAAGGANTPTQEPPRQVTRTCTSQTSCDGETCCTTRTCRGTTEVNCQPQTLRSTEDDDTPEAEPAPSRQGDGK
jgi:hypothetical protein